MAKRFEINRPLLRSLLVVAKAIEAHDSFSGGHAWRTSRYARALALAMGFEEGDVFLAQLGALLHDVGRVGIPDAVLLKQGRITKEELRVIRRHPEIGRDIIANHPLAPLVERPIVEHHLRADGYGYPARLKRNKPWIISQVVSVADAFDAMTSFHPARKYDTIENALMELEENRGRQFDAALADTFVGLVLDGQVDHVLYHAADGSLQVGCPQCGPILERPTVADGKDVECPSSNGDFVLNFAPHAFDLEWTGRSAYSQ